MPKRTEGLRDGARSDGPQAPLRGGDLGSRCPRPHCGGLLLLRAVVTVDGSCEEQVCVACSRAQLVAIREPYRPMTVSRDPEVAAWLSPPTTPGSGPESDDSAGIVWPPAVRLVRGLAEGTGD
jgi:hypothetical protein